MFDILVVEDEDIIRAGIINIIKKLSLPIGEIYEASNGQQACGVTAQKSPDIVITDIRMPLLNGLDYIEKLNQSNCNSKIIILTGYGEFSYAQRAISLNVEEYLLKPVRKDDLYKALVKIIEKLKIYKLNKHKNEVNIEKYNEITNELNRKVLIDFFEGKTNYENVKILKNIGCNYKKGCYIAVCVRDFNCLQNSNSYKNLKMFFENYYTLILHYTTKFNNHIYVLNTKTIDKEKFNYLLNKKLIDIGTGICVGVSEYGKDFYKLSNLVSQSKNALDNRMIDWSSNIHEYNHKTDLWFENETIPQMYYDSILNAVTLKNIDHIIKEVNRLFEYMINFDFLTPKLIKNSIQSIFLTLNQLNIGDTNVSVEDNVEMLYQSSHTLYDFRESVKRTFLHTIRLMNSHADISESNLIAKVIKYIEKNYKKDISLDMVVNQFSLNYNYFSYLFKKKTGSSFVTYLQNFRIEQSKKLLQNPTIKVYEVSKMVGFSDEKYFCRVFKKFTQMTPNEYRNKTKLLI